MFRKLGALVVGLGTSVCLAGATHAVAQQGDFNSPDLVLINGKIPLLLRTLLIRPQAGGSHDPSFLAGGSGAAGRLSAIHRRLIRLHQYQFPQRSAALPRVELPDLTQPTVEPSCIHVPPTNSPQAQPHSNQQSPQ